MKNDSGFERILLSKELILCRQMVIENDVDGEILMEMSDENLSALGISSFGHRQVAHGPF